MNPWPRFSEATEIAFDTETTGLNWPADRAFGFSISTPDYVACYHDIRHEPGATDWFNDEMSRFRGLVICHNASFDYKMAESVGLYLPLDRMDDTVIRACLINEHEHSFSLDHLSEKYLGERKEDIYPELARIFGGRATRNVQMPNLHRADPSVVSPYATKDPILTMKLWQWQEEEIKKQGIERICEFERRVFIPIVKAEMRGVRVDLAAAEKAMAKLTLVIDEDQKELNHLIGREMNVNSPKQAKEVFKPEMDEFGEWVADNGHVLQKTDSGNPSLDAEALRGMENDRRAQLILAIRSTVKTRDTFLGGHVLGHAVGDRVYPHVNQNKGEDAGTGSGRLSYTEPALQQIPSRNKKVASVVKPVFLPEPGCEWASFDQNSFEVRIFAHLVNNPVINAAYARDEKLDLHQYVADLTGLPRNATYSGQANAKQLDLSMIFNSGNGAIAEKMGMPWEWNSFKDKGGKIVKYKKAGEEAEAVIAKYHERVPGVRELAQRAKMAAESFGYVQTKHGRRLRFPHKFKTYKASGLAIQATSADINKEMWLLCDQLLSGPRHLIMNTHDSYEINVEAGADAMKLRKELQEGIRAAVPWVRVPLVLDLNGSGTNYWTAQGK